MDAKEYINHLRDTGDIITLAHFDSEGNPDCKTQAIVINKQHSIAVIVSPCGTPERTKVAVGAVVKFITHPEAEPKIVGSPAYLMQQKFQT